MTLISPGPDLRDADVLYDGLAAASVCHLRCICLVEESPRKGLLASDHLRTGAGCLTRL